MSNLNNQFDLYQTRNSLALPSKSKNMQIAHVILWIFKECYVISLPIFDSHLWANQIYKPPKKPVRPVSTK